MKTGLRLDSLVILSFNKLDVTRACVAAVVRGTRFAGPTELIVVDNGSTDGSADWIRGELAVLCAERGVGITVMKCFGGGDLLDAELSPAGAALTVNQCIHYALTRPGVSVVLAGAHSVEQLLQSLAYEDASEEERDYAAAFAGFPKISWKGHCMYCSHCAPCPVQISVADVTKFLNLAEAGSRSGAPVPETVREHYAVLPHHASECVQCGSCETRCPFGVSIRENMRNAAKVFGY